MRKYGERLAGKGFSAAARDLVEEVGLFDEARRGAQSLAAQARKVEAVQSLLRQLIEYEQREEQRAAEDTEDSEPDECCPHESASSSRPRSGCTWRPQW